jgi:hypothetical protein
VSERLLYVALLDEHVLKEGAILGDKQIVIALKCHPLLGKDD